MPLSCLVRMLSLGSVAGEVHGIRGDILPASRPGTLIFLQTLVQGKVRWITRAPEFAKQSEKLLLNFG